MAPDFSVEISDLRGWAEQVGRSGTHLYEGHNYSVRNLNDADFGRIMNLIKDDYTTLLPALHDVLLASNENMDKAKRALEYAAADYVDADRRFAGSLAELDGDVPVTVVDDGVANGFADLQTPTAQLSDPVRGNFEMPSLSLGLMWNKVCELLVALGASDPRKKICELLAGDIPKAKAQADAWRKLAEFVDDVQANLASGQTSIAKTWIGSASTSAGNHFKAWDTKFDNIESIMRKAAQYIDDAADQAVHLAQNATDVFMTIVSLLTAAFTKAAIPLFGQAYLAKKGWDAFKLYKGVVSVLLVFFTLLHAVKNLFVSAIGEFSRESLPKPPQV
ncbi:hypothetical protein AB0M22_08005 [Nocardia sp. NPDC051756]|uniref:WXG100 family type VII secretion target n=1 Tax=Nocardia sp. NPDC051756 TaxID=3154751 RepID=UPI00341292F1